MRKRVTLTRPGATLAGDLYLPSDRPRSGAMAVIVQGSPTSVKEQMPAHYARRFAYRGVVALSIDYSHYRQSSASRVSSSPQPISCSICTSP